MIAKVAIVVAGLIAGGVFLNLYYAVFAFFTVFLLSIESEAVFRAQYWLSFAAGVYTAYYLIRMMWPQVPKAAAVSENASDRPS